ncbi:hypothetical protein ACFSNO_32180 [Streptomyces cirratus]
MSVALTVTVPERAEPGDHPGAVVALEDEPATTPTPGLGVRQAVAARLYLRVTGPAAPALAVRDVRVRAHGNGAEITYTLSNLGNVTLRPRATLTATGTAGRGLPARPLDGPPAELLPGQEVRLRGRWADPPALQWARLTVRARDGGASAEGTADYARHPRSRPLWPPLWPSRPRPGRRWERHRGEWPV